MVATLCLTGGLRGGWERCEQVGSLHSAGSLITDKQTGFRGSTESVVMCSWTRWWNQETSG